MNKNKTSVEKKKIIIITFPFCTKPSGSSGRREPFGRTFFFLYTYVLYNFRGPVHLAISTVDSERNEALVQHEGQAHIPASLTSLHLHDFLFSDFRASYPAVKWQLIQKKLHLHLNNTTISAWGKSRKVSHNHVFARIRGVVSKEDPFPPIVQI